MHGALRIRTAHAKPCIIRTGNLNTITITITITISQAISPDGQPVLGGKCMFRQSGRLLHHAMALPLHPRLQALLGGKNTVRQSGRLLHRIRSFYLKEDAGKRLFSSWAISSFSFFLLFLSFFLFFFPSFFPLSLFPASSSRSK